MKGVEERGMDKKQLKFAVPKALTKKLKGVSRVNEAFENAKLALAVGASGPPTLTSITLEEEAQENMKEVNT